MIRGITVTVHHPYENGVDRFNNVVYGMTGGEVENVLVQPGATSLLDASRPEGVAVSYTLHFPKTYKESLEGCLVTLPAPWEGTYRVIGDPQPYIDANTPTDWDRPCEVEAAHG